MITKPIKHVDQSKVENIIFKSMIYSVDADFNTILHIGARKKSIKTLNFILSLLIEKRLKFVNIFKKKNSNGESFFQLVCNQGCVEIVERVLKHKSMLAQSYDPLNDYDAHMNTPLMSAILNNQYKCVVLLLEYGADVNAENTSKQNGMHLSCSIGSYEIVEVLLKYGCHHTSVDANKMNPLDYACQNGNVDVVRLLLSLDDAHLLITSNCLDYAIEHNHHYVAEVLLKSKYWTMVMKYEESPLIHNLISKMVIKNMSFLELCR